MNPHRSAQTACPRPDELVLPVRDLERTERFYCEVLGLRRAGVPGGRVRLSSDLSPGVKMGLEKCAGPVQPRAIRLELSDRAEVLDRYLLARMHGIGSARLEVRRGAPVLLLRDPDGHEIECFTAGSVAGRLAGARRVAASTGWAGRSAEPRATPASRVQRRRAGAAARPAVAGFQNHHFG